MRVNLIIDDSNFLHFNVMDGGHYKSPGRLSLKEQLEIHKIGKKDPGISISVIRRQQAEKLKEFIPLDFHRLVRNKYPAIKKRGMILILEQPLLADLPWEFIPLIDREAGDGRIPIEWQELPLMRSLPGSSYHRLADVKNNLKACFFQTKREAGYLLDNLESILNTMVIFDKIFDNENCDNDTARADLLRCLRQYDFIMIASHAVKDAFMTEKHETYCKAVDITSVELPRFILSDCCHSAETGMAGTGNRTEDWPETLLKAFIRNDGPAVYIGNIGMAKYKAGENDRIGTYFAGDITKRIFTDDTVRGSFTEALRKTRIAQRQDQDNSQVVYIAEDYDPSCSFEDILTKAVLPSVPGSSADWRGGIIIGATGLLSVPLFYYVSGIWNWKTGAVGLLLAAIYIIISLIVSIRRRNSS